MAYTNDLNSLHNPATSTAPPASWGDAVRDNFLCVERGIFHQALGAANATISSGTLLTVTNGFKLTIMVRALMTATGGSIGVRLNGDSGANYSRQLISSVDAVATAIENTGSTEFTPVTITTTANRWANLKVEVFDYLGSNHKSMLSHCYDPGSLTTQQMYIGGGHWAATAAITSVSIHASTSTFVAGSSLTIYATPSV